MKNLRNIPKLIKKFFYLHILRRKYYRTGACSGCGRCCRKIYVKHKNVIQTEEEFKKLQFLHPFYTYLKIIDKDETGLVFECMNLDKETNKCKIHKKRPGICRRYPQEELFTMGGMLAANCGYRLEPIETFEEVLNRAEKRQRGKRFFGFERSAKSKRRFSRPAFKN